MEKRMAEHEEVHDSPETWVSEHIRNYVETDGKKGHDRYGVPNLLLTTRGRKSGLLRRTALIYGKDGDNYVIVASNGGSPDHPLWYLNLVANPEVEVQVNADKFTAVAHTASAEEKAHLWKVMCEIFPTYNRYQKGTEREIPVVVLVPKR
jgi:deazaflavin-dependent oxidoreductase (nitroreductase family)